MERPPDDDLGALRSAWGLLITGAGMPDDDSEVTAMCAKWSMFPEASAALSRSL